MQIQTVTQNFVNCLKSETHLDISCVADVFVRSGYDAASLGKRSSTFRGHYVCSTCRDRLPSDAVSHRGKMDTSVPRLRKRRNSELKVINLEVKYCPEETLPS
jgi:hypothetical protein